MEIKSMYDYDVNKRVKELGIELKKIENPITNNYLHSVKTGNLLFLAGKVSQRIDGTFVKGKIGKTLTTQ